MSQLPEVMRAAAEPIGNIDNITVVGTDGAGAVSKIAGNVLGEGAATIKALTGIDLSAALAGFAAEPVRTPSEDGVPQH